MSYLWLQAETPLLRIGHALGQGAGQEANQLSAVQRARQAGLRILEVDLWLQDGTLHCFHGPGAPAPLQPGSCTFERLVRATASGGEYLVLDIKTGFEAAALAVAAVLERMPAERPRIIFQLYRPQHVRFFNSLPHARDLAGPIITAYVSRASLAQVLAGARRAGVRAVSIPVSRLDALPAGAVDTMNILLHPVHDCATRKAAVDMGAHGIYTLASMACSSDGGSAGASGI